MALVVECTYLMPVERCAVDSHECLAMLRRAGVATTRADGRTIARQRGTQNGQMRHGVRGARKMPMRIAARLGLVSLDAVGGWMRSPARMGNTPRA